MSSGAAVLGACAAVLASGCGGDGDKTDTTATTSASTTATTPPTSTSTTPASADSTSTPEATVRNLWHQLQIGSVPTAATLYDYRVRSRVGASTVVGGLRVIAPQFAKDLPTIDNVTPTKIGTQVAVHRNVAGNKKLYSSYLVRKPKGRSGYVVVYDSALSQGIFAHTRDKEQRKINPGAKRFSPRAIQRAKSLQSQYDSLATSG